MYEGHLAQFRLRYLDQAIVVEYLVDEAISQGLDASLVGGLIVHENLLGQMTLARRFRRCHV